MIKNEKGFALTEILILSAVVIGVLTFMFVQFKTINRSYQKSFKYDTPEGLYLANNILNYISSDNYDTLVEQLSATPEGYIDITNCSIDIYNKSSLCESLYRESGIEQIIFTKENPSKVKMNIRNFKSDMQDFIKQIKTINSETDYRIIIKYTNGTFATMRFNKGNAYVQKGLIAYLDAINNTGEGHSNDTTIWKDLSGNNNDAILYNNPAWNSNSIIFDGLTNFGRLENTAGMTYENGITLEARVKILSDIGKIPSDNSIEFFNNWDSAGLGMKFTGTMKFRTSIYYTSYNSIEAPNPSNYNEYYTLTLTYDNTTQKLYINGNQIVSDTYTNNIIINPSNAPIGLGGNPKIVSGMDCYANVEFQNVLIYDRALSENEVQRNYQADMARY